MTWAAIEHAYEVLVYGERAAPCGYYHGYEMFRRCGKIFASGCRKSPERMTDENKNFMDFRRER
jgi:hypothetical protein